jgi:3-deoxy-D-manno-octulosonic-acid transferase
MYLIYNLLSWPVALLLSPWLAYRSWRGRLPGLGQRLGLIPLNPITAPESKPTIWLHAVSLGEVKAAAPLLGELRAQFPGLRIVLTTSTRTGWQAARECLSSSDVVLFPPFDLAWICRRFLRRIRPQALLVMETELWPNLFREAKRSGVPLLLVNGRVSDRAFPRYRASKFFWQRVLAQPDAILTQSKRDAERFLALGAPEDKVEVAGNLKYAIRPLFSPIVPRLRAMAEEAGAGPILVAGSTMPGEEKFLAAAIRELGQEFPHLLTILAPRHPERFASVGEELRTAGIPFLRRSALSILSPGVSQGQAPGSDLQPKLELPGVVLLDSIGELGAVYELADVAFVGGTLVPTGGHNILEPACFGKAILIGPSMSNFQDIADAFLRDGRSAGLNGVRMGAAVQVLDASSLSSALRYLFRNPALCRRLGEAARGLVEKELDPIDRIRRELVRLAVPPSDPPSHLPNYPSSNHADGHPADNPASSGAELPQTAVADARPLTEARK